MPLLTQNGNYLRVRGEYRYPDGEIPVDWELPPRARRILLQEKRYEDALGTTSACAENTRHDTRRADSTRNYLRVRGEYGSGMRPGARSAELPPRARRIRNFSDRLYISPGTTSACAENTGLIRDALYSHRNYLRVRGEYVNMKRSTYASKELPPRARRILLSSDLRSSPAGTTSACAENTP